VIGSGRAGTLTKVDTRALRAGKPIALGAHPRGIALHPDGRHALVALNSAPGAVLLVDIENGRVTRRIATHDFPYRIAISADGRHALVSHSGVGADTVTPLDLQRHRTGRRIRTGADPAGVAFAGPGATALVANTAAGTVAFVDTVAGRRTRTVRVGGAPAAIAAGRGRAYVADLLTGHVTAIRTGVFA
jgi:DNA-binding beta-propeller fold protein YncE